MNDWTVAFGMLAAGLITGLIMLKRPPAALVKGFMWSFIPLLFATGAGAYATHSRAKTNNRDDIALHDNLARACLDREDLAGVAKETRYVLQRAPNDARALTYQAMVHISMNQPDVAAKLLRRATQSDPNLLDAWVTVAYLNAKTGNHAQAVAAIGEAKRRHPEAATHLDELLTRLQ